MLDQPKWILFSTKANWSQFHKLYLNYKDFDNM